MLAAGLGIGYMAVLALDFLTLLRMVVVGFLGAGEHWFLGLELDASLALSLMFVDFLAWRALVPIVLISVFLATILLFVRLALVLLTLTARILLHFLGGLGVLVGSELKLLFFLLDSRLPFRVFFRLVIVVLGGSDVSPLDESRLVFKEE